MRTQRIETTLLPVLKPHHIEIINESDNHSGPLGRETHFKLIIVSDAFKNMTSVARHQWIYKLLASELKSGLHALSLALYTVDEQKNGLNTAPVSPPCQHRPIENDG